MAAKPALIAAGILGALVLGTGGYFANEWRVCRSLHQDFMTFAKASLTDQQLMVAADSAAVAKMMKLRADERVEKAGQTLFDLQDRCGEKAAVDAQLDAQQMILGSSPI